MGLSVGKPFHTTVHEGHLGHVSGAIQSVVMYVMPLRSSEYRNTLSNKCHSIAWGDPRVLKTSLELERLLAITRLACAATTNQQTQLAVRIVDSRRSHAQLLAHSQTVWRTTQHSHQRPFGHEKVTRGAQLETTGLVANCVAHDTVPEGNRRAINPLLMADRVPESSAVLVGRNRWLGCNGHLCRRCYRYIRLVA